MITVKNSDLNNETIEALNRLVEMDINASAAFKLTRIVKEISSIVEDKLKMERKIFEKYSEKDAEGRIILPKDAEGNEIQGAVNITDMQNFSLEMSSLMNVENQLPYDKMNFEELNLQTAKIKDLIKLEFLFI